MQIKIDIPDNKIGNWAIETFNVSEKDIFISLFTYKNRFVPPGTYKKLTYKGQVIMSNTPAEIRDFLHFYYKAQGNVLINGLGLGVCLSAILQKKEVISVTIIEISKEVISLVSPYIKDNRINIINDDAFTWQPPKGIKYDVVWHDIWNNLCFDNLKEMTKLHRKYGKKCIWQDSWCKHLCKKRQIGHWAQVRG